MKHWRLFFVLFFLCLPVCAQAPQAANADDEASHQALREMRDAMVNALNKGDIEALIPHLHKNIVFTAMNGEVCRGHDALRVYFNRMMKGPGHIVESLHVNPTVDHLTDLYGGTTGVAYGSSIDHYNLTTGQEFEVNARWSATLVKENGNWQIASFQSAANIFDNPLLNKAKSTLYWGAGGAGIIGLVLGLLIGKRWGKSAV
jgi:ketosteroid isomerase-like protein